MGISTHTALSLIVETGDFKRFAKGNIYAAYLGLAPGEHSSSTSVNRLGSLIDNDSLIERIIDYSVYDTLRESLLKLTDREVEVLSARYGLHDGRQRTVEEVGQQYNVTRERIRQIEKKAGKKSFIIITNTD